MKKLFYLLSAILCCMTVAAQGSVGGQSEVADTVLSGDMDKALRVWLALNEAVADSDYEAIKIAADSMRQCNATDLNTLSAFEDSHAPLNGHIVFDEVFAERMAAGEDVISSSECYSSRWLDDIIIVGATEHEHKTGEYGFGGRKRGQPGDGSIKTKTVLVRQGRSTTCRFYAKGHQELAVAAEAGGLITMKIHVVNSAGLDIRYDDTKDVKRGRNFRKAAFEVPKDKQNVVTLVIVNCCDKDISVVVISN